MKKIYKNISTVLLLTVLGKIASFLSEIIVASFLGTSKQGDAYSMISGIHAVIYPMLGIGIWSIFLPEYQKKKILAEKKTIKEYNDKVITLFTILSTSISLLVFIFANNITYITSPGFDEETKNLAATLLRIYSPYFIFSTISSVYAAMLQSHGKFLGSQIREFVSYLPTIIIGPILYSKMGVAGFAFALIGGSILRLTIQLPFIDWGYKYKPNFHFKDNAILKLLKKSPAAIITSGSDQLLTLVDKSMASTLAVGSVSSLNYGHKLTNAINGIITTSVSTVIFPEMPKMLANKQYKELGNLSVKILVVISIIIFPIMAIMLAYSKEIVTLVYARGTFDENSAMSTTTVFCGYLVGFYFIGIKQITDKILYSMEKNNTVMVLNIANVILNIVLNVIFINILGLPGLAYATSISSIIYILISAIILKRSVISLNIIELIKKLSLVLLVSAIPVFTLSRVLEYLSINWTVSLFAVIILSAIVYHIIYTIIKFDEYCKIKNSATSLIKKKKRRS